MSKVIAIFGAGTGLGASVARRFGREGFRVALVARRRDRLDALAAQLAGDSIEAAPFAADLSHPGQVPALVETIRGHFGRIDVIEYGPIGREHSFTPAAKLDAASLERLSRLYLLTPVEVVRAVLPEMIERGDGALLLTQGLTALMPLPFLSGGGAVMAAARNYLYSLHGELAGTGVYAGALTIGALIARSEAADKAAAAPEAAMPALPGGLEFPVVDPDDLAAYYWDMYTKRDRIEQVHPTSPTPRTAAA